MWAALAKGAMGGLKAGAKKVATDKLLNRKKKRPKKSMASGKEVSDGIMNKGEEGKKGGALAVRPTTGLVHTARDFDSVSTTPGESDIVIIRKQVIQVRDIIKDSHRAKQQERKNLRKAKQLDKKKKEEEKIETSKLKVKPKEAKVGMKMPNLGLGIGTFLVWLAAGVVFAKLNDLMPTLKNILKVLKFVADFIGNVLNFALGAVVGFIDLAYAGVENLRKLIVGIGGEGAGELFDKFGTLFTQVMNGALIAAMIGAMIGRGRRFRKPKGPKPKPKPKPKWQKNLQKKWKNSKLGKFVRNQRAGFQKFTRRVSRGPIGRTLNALRPKNVGKFIMEGGVDKALKGGFKNVKNFMKSPVKTVQNLTKNIKPVKTIQNLTKKIKPVKTVQNISKNITKNLKQIKPVKTIQNLTKNIKPVKTIQNLTKNIKPVKTIQNLTKNIKPLKTVQNLTKNIKPVKTIQNLTKNIKPVQTIQNLTKNIKPVKTIQNLTKNIKPVQTIQNLTKQNLNPFKGLNLGQKAGNLWKGAKNLGSKALSGVDNWAKTQMGNLGSMWKGAKAWGAKQAAKLGDIVELAKNPKKLMELMKGKLTKSIDDIVKKNKTLKNLLSMAKNPKKISGAIKGMLNTAKKSKGILNVKAALSRAKAAKVGGVDKIIAAVMALIDYMALKESPINAIVKAVSGMLGYAAGFAIGAPFGGMPGFITGMAGGALGELAGYGLLKGLAKGFPGLTQVVDPIMGAGPDGDGRPILRDPDGPVDHMLNQPKKGDGGEAMREAQAEMSTRKQKLIDEKKYGSGISIEYEGKVYKPGDEGYAEIIKGVTSTVSGKHKDLSVKPSYGDGVVVENTTTYIQEVEVPA